MVDTIIKPKDTRRRQRLVEEIIKEANKNLSLNEIKTKAGYSKKSRQIYTKSTKAYIRTFLEATGNSLEDCKKRFNLLMNMAIDDRDLREARANNENITRMAGGFKDKIEQTTINTDTLFNEYKANRLKEYNE